MAQGNTEEEVLNKIAEHGMKETDFSPEKIKQFRKLIHEESEYRA